MQNDTAIDSKQQDTSLATEVKNESSHASLAVDDGWKAMQADNEWYQRNKGYVNHEADAAEDRAAVMGDPTIVGRLEMGESPRQALQGVQEEARHTAGIKPESSSDYWSNLAAQGKSAQPQREAAREAGLEL